MRSKWQSLPTEAINPSSLDIDKLAPGDIVDLMISEDRKMLAAVHREKERIAVGIEIISRALRSGGRVVFVGAGTSGRLGVVESAEMPPTFGTKPDLVQILDLEIVKVMERLKGRKLQLVLDEKARDFLVQKGYDPTYGARPMRRAVERFLEDRLAEEILKGSLHEGEPVHVTVDGDKLTFTQSSPAAGALSS